MTDLIQQLHHYANGECDMTPVGSTLLEAADRIEELEAKLAKAMGCLRFYADFYKSPFGTRARIVLAEIVLAELEGGEEAADTAWRGRE